MHKGTLMKNEIKCFGQVCFLAGALALANSPVFAAAPDRAAFDKACKSCHGPAGEGNPAIAKALKATMRPLGGAEVQAKTDQQLKGDITKGVGKMKPVTSLSDTQIKDVVNFLRALKQ
jgi:mono/diheme cytochrome c family protein